MNEAVADSIERFEKKESGRKSEHKYVDSVRKTPKPEEESYTKYHKPTSHKRTQNRKDRSPSSETKPSRF